VNLDFMSKIKAEPDWFFKMLVDSDEHCLSSRQEFPYICYDSESFLKIIKPHMKRAKTFIDVGCGGGDKLALVKQKWPKVEVFGIEHTPMTAIWAGLHGKVFCQDALKVDYSPYDVIYAYWPICNIEKMDLLCQRIRATKKCKAVFVLVGCGRITEGKTGYPVSLQSCVSARWKWQEGCWIR